jgi:hypothetical protein
LLRAIEDEREGLLEVKAVADSLVESFLKNVLETSSGAITAVGTLAKFTSGASIAVSLLSSTPTIEAKVPVYGGNGIAGYTTDTLLTTPEKTVVIGRVGAYCGRTYFVEGDVWVSDNALFATSISDAVIPEFLAMCLSASNLNRLSTGGAQPLINQQIVNAVRVPLPSIEEQKKIVEMMLSVTETGNASLHRADGLKELKQLALEEPRSV